MFGGLTFKVADEAQRSRALELRRQVYSAELGHHGLDEFDAGAYHLIALDPSGTILATMRLVGPEQRPFDVERYARLADFVPADRTPAELSRFCVLPRHRQVRSEQFVHLGMFKLLYCFAVRQRLTDLVAMTLPHLESLYRVAFFSPVHDIEHPIFGPARVMRLDLKELPARYSRSNHPIARLLFRTEVPNVIV